MYESPINLIEEQISTDIEKTIDGEIWKTVREIGIDVDKEELVKALKYDRDQYEKGYRDAKDRYFRVGHWMGVNPMVDTLMCSECGENIISEEFKSNYCPNCGARMVEPQESEE